MVIICFFILEIEPNSLGAPRAGPLGGAFNTDINSTRQSSLLTEDFATQAALAAKPEQVQNLLNFGVKISKDDFQFMKVIGRGSFGKVYMCKKRDRPKEVFAMKVLAKNVLHKKNLLVKTQGKFFGFYSNVCCS